MGDDAAGLGGSRCLGGPDGAGLRRDATDSMAVNCEWGGVLELKMVMLQVDVPGWGCTGVQREEYVKDSDSACRICLDGDQEGKPRRYKPGKQLGGIADTKYYFVKKTSRLCHKGPRLLLS